MQLWNTCMWETAKSRKNQVLLASSKSSRGRSSTELSGSASAGTCTGNDSGMKTLSPAWWGLFRKLHLQSTGKLCARNNGRRSFITFVDIHFLSSPAEFPWRPKYAGQVVRVCICQIFEGLFGQEGWLCYCKEKNKKAKNLDVRPTIGRIRLALASIVCRGLTSLLNSGIQSTWYWKCYILISTLGYSEM